MVPRIVMSVDAETRGLFGEAFAVGWVVFVDGKEVDHGRAACPWPVVRPGGLGPAGDAEGERWVQGHVAPVVGDHTHPGPREVRSAFWRAWIEVHRNQGVLWVDCGHPVEARLLLDCVRDDPARARDFPRPVVDLCGVLLARGLDPLADHPRRPAEIPAHDPVCDARHAGRLFFEALSGPGA